MFASSRLKLKRASHLIDELDALLEQHAAENPIKSEFVPGTGDEFWSPTTKITVPEPPEMAPVLIGDIVHNLRTSLDHMASEMARLRSKPDKNVYFPFADNIDGLEEMIKRKNFGFCGQAAVDLLRALKPYKNGNIELRAIHDLDVLDKHRELVPQLGVKPLKTKVFERTSPVVDGRWQAKWVPVQFTETTHAFPKDEVLGDRPIIQTLKELVELCEGILEAFTALDFSK